MTGTPLTGSLHNNYIWTNSNAGKDVWLVCDPVRACASYSWTFPLERTSQDIRKKNQERLRAAEQNWPIFRTRLATFSSVMAEFRLIDSIWSILNGGASLWFVSFCCCCNFLIKVSRLLMLLDFQASKRGKTTSTLWNARRRSAWTFWPDNQIWTRKQTELYVHSHQPGGRDYSPSGVLQYFPTGVRLRKRSGVSEVFECRGLAGSDGKNNDRHIRPEKEQYGTEQM